MINLLIFLAIIIYISGLGLGILIGFGLALLRGLYVRQQRLQKLYILDKKFEDTVSRSIAEVEQAGRVIDVI